MDAVKKRELLAMGALLVAALFWAGNAVMARGMVGTLPPMAMSFWRWVLAFCILLPFAWPHLRKAWPVIRKNWGILALLAFLSAGIFNTLLYLAAQTTTAVNITLVNASMPIFISIIAFVLNGERLSRNQTLGICIALPGTVIIISRGSLEVLTSIGVNPGDLIMVLAISCWGLYSVLLKGMKIQLHPLALLITIIALALPMVFMAYLAELSMGHGFTPGLELLPAFLYIGIFPSIFSYLGWNHGVATLGPARASMFIYMMPVFGAVLAVVFLGERLYGYHAIGAILVLIGLYLATWASAGGGKPTIGPKHEANTHAPDIR